MRYGLKSLSLICSEAMRKMKLLRCLTWLYIKNVVGIDSIIKTKLRSRILQGLTNLRSLTRFSLKSCVLALDDLSSHLKEWTQLEYLELVTFPETSLERRDRDELTKSELPDYDCRHGLKLNCFKELIAECCPPFRQKMHRVRVYIWFVYCQTRKTHLRVGF